MLRVCLVAIFLCALVPLQGFAQNSPPSPAPSIPEEDPYDPKGDPTDSDSHGGYDPTPSEGLRASHSRGTSEALAGILLGTAGAVPGLLMMGKPCLTDECDNSANSQFLTGLAWGVAGWTLGSGLGITVGGSMAGGKGGFLPALGGATLGALVAVGGSVGMVGLSKALYAVSEPLGILSGYVLVPLVSIPLLVVAPLVGGISFYEKSHESTVAQQQTASAGVRMLPVVSVSSSGGLVAGLMGRF